MCVGGVALCLLLAGCEGVVSELDPRATLHQRLDLPKAEEDNILTRAIAEQPVGAGWVMVPASEFYDAVGDRSTEEVETLNAAMAAAEVANDPWTSGVYSRDFVESQEVQSNLWLVVSDATTFDDAILGSNFTLVPLPLSFTPSWSATNIAFTMEMASVGMGRCCGPLKLCETAGTPPVPCPEEGRCGDGIVVHQPTGAGDPRTQAGLQKRGITWFNSGVPSEGFCQPRVIPGCSNATPMCSEAELGADWSQSWDATLPLNNAWCSAGERPVSGRVPPPQCLYAGGVKCGGPGCGGQPSGAIKGGVAGGAGRRPECDGHCYACEDNNAWTDSNFRPRQCDYMRPASGFGLPASVGAGVCDATANEVLLNQAALRASINWHLGDPPRTDGCSPPTSRGVQVCTRCEGKSCRRVIKRTPNPVAHDACGQSTGSGACTGAGGGSGSGGSSDPSRSAQDNQSNAPVNPESPPPSTPTSPPSPPATQPSGTSNPQSHAPASPKPTTETGPTAEGMDPVQFSSGAFTLSQTDLSFPGASRPLELRRSYDSRSAYRSPLGSNWTHNWDVRLIPLNDFNRPSWADPYCAGSPEEVTCVMMYVGGTPRLFSRDIRSGIYVPQAGVMASLIPTDSGWVMDTAEQHLLTFDADGYLEQDVDRLGNGFKIDWEYTAAGRVFAAVCPTKILQLDGQTGYVHVQGPTHWSISAQCNVLGGMVGQREPVQYDPTDTWTWTVTLPPSPPVLLQDAAALVSHLQTYEGRKAGAGAPWGNHLKRVTAVREIKSRDVLPDGGVTVSATARALTFEYWADTDTALVVDSTGVRRAGMLKAVTGPGGARVEYGYKSAEPAGLPKWLNEVFLASVTRADQTPTEQGLTATPSRSTSFTYAWATNTLVGSELTEAENRYRDFLKAQVGCTYYNLNLCGQHVQPLFTRYTVEADVANYSANFRSQVADNIIRVDNHGIVESETRYEVALFSAHFDKATRQRWGSSDVPPTPLAHGFTVTLPEASLQYVDAAPIQDGAEDATTAFLPAVIASRYPLESIPAATVTSSLEKGLLLPPDSLETVALAGRLLLAEGFVVPQKPPEVPACKEKNLPGLRTRLAGYQPSFDYFDTTLPTPPTGAQAAYDTVTEGVDLNMALKRSRLSCEVLAMAQTWDARHNDMEWTWQKNGQGVFEATKVYGRRSHMSANANRICAWTKLTDRDGVQHLYGLNYHGRQVVDAVLVTIGGQQEWRVAETLYNADGNVLARRRTMPQTTNWSPTAGDTRYQYTDTWKQPNGTVMEPTPCYWSRRGNLAKVIDRPRGGTVTDWLESNPANAETTKGRYETYEYEPLFNQVLRVRRGVFDATLNHQELSVTTTTFDYQEGAISNVSGILGRLQERGCLFDTQSNGDIDPQTAMPWPVPFGLGDVNGDTKVSNTRAGLPIRVQTTAGGVTEESLYTWNDRARLRRYKGPDASEVAFTYFPVGESTGAGAEKGGLVASIEHQVRKAWPSSQGPARAACPHLAGPYQWLLPATCSSNDLAGQLKTQLHLPAEAAAHIASQQAVTTDGVTSFEYFSTGHSKQVTSPDGRVVKYERDVDGRVKKEAVYDGAALHSYALVTLNAQLRPVTERQYDAANQDFGAVIRSYDEEGNVLYECQEFISGGCSITTRGQVPANGRSGTYWYTAEGALKRAQDAEGALVDYVRDARGWVTQTTASASGEQSRVNQVAFDDDGHPTTLKYGVVSGAPTLMETRAYDGSGRLTTIIATDGLRHVVKHSRRDVAVQVETNNPAYGSGVLWTDRWEFDAFARPYRKQTNGVLVKEVARRPGGQVYASFSYGKRPVYTTYDADGAAVWSEDDGGELVTVLTGRPDSRVVTSSTIRKAGATVATTSGVTELDVLGNATTLMETGSGTGQTRLTRPKTLQRNVLGLVTNELDADGATSELVYDFDGRLTTKRVLRTVGGLGFDVTSFQYDRRGGLRFSWDPKNELTTITYTKYGELKTRRTPGVTDIFATWQYDVLGRTTVETLGNSTLNYDYNADGTLWRIRTGDSAQREYTWDSLKRLATAKHWNRGLGFTGSPIATGQWPVLTDFAYDTLGRVSTEGNTVGTRPRRAVTSNFTTTWTPSFPGGLQRDVGRPDGSSSLESFDTLGRLTLLQRSTPGLTSYSSWRNFLGDFETQQQSATSAAPVTTTTTRDALGQPLRWQTVAGTTNVLDIEVLRDAMGRVGSYSQKLWRPSQSTPDTLWRGYAYDGMGRVTTLHEAGTLPNTSGVSTHTLTTTQVEGLATQVGAATWGYSREAAVGSLLSITRTNGSAPARFTAPARNAGYQLPSYDIAGGGSRPVTHDNAGRMSADGRWPSPGTPSRRWWR